MPANASANKIFTVLAMGDSTTAGTPDFYSPAESPPNGSGNEQSQYAYWILQKHPDWVLLNRGVRGQRSDQILFRFKRDAEVFKPDVAVILAGVNDIYQEYPADHVISKLKEMYEFAISKKVKVVACTILPYNFATPEAQEKIKKVNEWIRSYAEEKGLLFCDTFSVESSPEKTGKLISTVDGIHPDVDGYRRMGEAIMKVLEKA